MSKAPSPRPVGPLLERLPPGPRERLLRIGDEGRGIFGAARFQSIFEAHLDLFVSRGGRRNRAGDRAPAG